MKCLKSTTIASIARDPQDTGALLPRICDRDVGASVVLCAIGTPPALPMGMQQLILSADQVALIDESATPAAPVALDEEALMAMSLSEAKHLAASDFERRYLVRIMARAGSVSEGARLTGLDRTNFRRLLQRHGLR